MNNNVKEELGMDREKAIEALTEHYNLVEDYSPSWYSEDIHLQAAAAVQALPEPPRRT
jgi:hypothetical protein